MEIHQIRYFLAVVRERNFSRAADSCNITQPALTRAIQRLEDDVRGTVFERRPGHVELTELGRLLQPQFEAVMMAVGEARTLARGLQRERRHRLRIGMMCTLGADHLTMLLGALAVECPQIEVELSEGRGQEVVAELVKDSIDVAIAGLPRYPIGIDAEPLYTERYLVAMSPEHPLASRQTIAVSDLTNQSYIERVKCEFEQHFVDAHGEWPVPIDVRCRSEREDYVQALVAAGLGVSIMPASMSLRADIVTRPLVMPEMSRTIALLTVRDRELPPPVAILRRLTGNLKILS